MPYDKERKRQYNKEYAKRNPSKLRTRNWRNKETLRKRSEELAETDPVTDPPKPNDKKPLPTGDRPNLQVLRDKIKEMEKPLLTTFPIPKKYEDDLEVFYD